MVLSKDLFKLNGELRSKELESSYREEYWKQSKLVYFISYNICCILLLLAGIFFDYYRTFYTGSVQILLSLRIGLVISGLLMIPLYYKEKKTPKSLDWYCFFLMTYSSVIITLLTLWTKGTSFTLMPGILIMIVSFYIALPSRMSHVLISSSILFFTYCFYFNYALVGLKAHYYMCFMLFAINCVLIYFKIVFSKNLRTNFLLKEYHREVGNAKNTILNIIGHDLKNPLTIIMNKTDFVKRAIENDDKAAAIKHLDSIESANLKVSELLNSLLDWALSKNGDEANETKSNNIEEACINAIEFCNDLAQNKNLKISIDVDNHIFHFNKNMLETIIRNLLTNSIKFSPPNKKIQITGKKINNHYILSIKDEGIGINDTTLENLLKGVNFTSQNGTNGEKGTGIGMRMVHHFIKKHGGELDITSTPDQGSSFTIKLPL